MDRVTRNLAIQDLFGAEAAPFVMNLVESQDLLNKTLGLASNKLKTAGSMQREFSRQQKTGKFAAQKMNAANKDLSATLGNVFRIRNKEGATISKSASCVLVPLP